MNSEIDLSVIVPNYNHAHFLAGALGAIFSQSVSAREVIVIDDGSTDDSIFVLQELQKKYERLQIVKNSQNIGVHASVNNAMMLTKGKFIAFFSADDLIFPGFFSACKAAWDKHPDAGICFGDFATFRPREEHRHFRLLPVNAPMYLQPEELCRLFKRKQFTLGANVSICRRDLIIQFGGHQTELKSIADMYLYHKIAFQFPTVYVPQVFGSCRIVDSSYGASVRRNFRARYKLWSTFIRELEKKENTTFRKRVLQARLFGIGGYFILLYLLTRPSYWVFYPVIFWNVIARKIKTFTEARRWKKRKPA